MGVAVLGDLWQQGAPPHDLGLMLQGVGVGRSPSLSQSLQQLSQHIGSTVRGPATKDKICIDVYIYV